MEVKEVARVLNKIFDESIKDEWWLRNMMEDQMLLVTHDDGSDALIRDVEMRVFFGYNGRRYVIIPMGVFGDDVRIPSNGNEYYYVMIEQITPTVTPVRVALEKSGVMRVIDKEVQELVNIISEVGNRYISMDMNARFGKEVDVKLITILKPIDPNYNNGWIEFIAYEVEYVPMAIILGYLAGGNDHAKAVFIDLLKRRLDNEYMLSTVFSSLSDLVVMAWKERKSTMTLMKMMKNEEETIEDVDDLAEEFGLKG